MVECRDTDAASELIAYRDLGLYAPGDEVKLLRSKDTALGGALPVNYIGVTGRKKDTIIRGGTNISPSELEELLLEHPAVADVAVVGMPDRVLGEKACAFVVPSPVRRPA